MNHYTAPEFWALYAELPEEIRELADKNYGLLKADSRHPSLHFKQVGRFWSVRVGLYYRAVGVSVSDSVLWFWIGPHAEYDKIVG